MKHVVVSSAGETQPFYSAIFNLNAGSRETERSDRVQSNLDAIDAD